MSKKSISTNAITPNQESSLEAECKKHGDEARDLAQRVKEADSQLREALEAIRKLSEHRDQLAERYEDVIEELDQAEDRLEAARKATRRSRRRLGKKPSLEYDVLSLGDLVGVGVEADSGVDPLPRMLRGMDTGRPMDGGSGPGGSGPGGSSGLNS